MADTVPMVNPTPPPTAAPVTNPPEPPRNRRMMGAAAALGAAVLVIGGLAARSAMVAPKSAAAASAVKGREAKAAGAAAVEAGLEAAAKYQRENQFEPAATILSKLSQTNPEDAPVRRAYAQALMGLKQFKPAYEQYQAAVSLQPAGTVRAMARGEDKAAGQLHFEAGTCASAAGLTDRAVEHYSMAQTADPREPKYPLYLAMVQLKGNDAESEAAAMASLLRATHLNPDLAEAWGTLAELELRKEQLGLAAQHVETARKIQPGVAKWRVVEARILNRKGEAERAATLLLSLEASQRMQPGVMTVLGESYGLLKKPEEAARMYAEAFAAPVGTPSPELAYQAALWFERAGDTGKAADYARTAALLGHADAKAMVGRVGEE